ncbi:MAG: radical SAM protein [Pseudobdellovibrio sp.]
MRISTVLIIIIRNIEMTIRDLLGLNYRPYKLLLELTDYCNSKCKTCFIWKNSEDKKVEIKISDLESALKEYGANLLWIALGGVEITLYKDFDKLLEVIRRTCPKLRILTFTTNALKPEKLLEYSLKAKTFGYDLFVTISLDGDQKTHDFVRGVQGNFEKAQQALADLKNNNIWAHFGLTVSAYNTDYIENNLKNDIKEIRAFSFEHSGGIYKTEADILTYPIMSSLKKIKSIYKVRQIGEIVEYMYILLGELFFASEKTKLPVPCEVISSSLHIRSNGDINPCMYLPKIGNIKNQTISDSLLSRETKNLRLKALAGDCAKCWMNCYAPHSIMRHPIKALASLF